MRPIKFEVSCMNSHRAALALAALLGVLTAPAAAQNWGPPPGAPANAPQWGPPPGAPASGPQWGAPPGGAARPAPAPAAAPAPAVGPQWGPPPAAGAQSGPPGGFSLQPPQQQPQQMPCEREIIPMRQAIERDGNVVKKSIEGKQDRAIICTHLKKFATTEAKFVKYIKTNAQTCGVPPQILVQLEKNHGNTLKLRGQACQAAPTAGGRPQGSGLSEALGTTRGSVPPGAASKNTGTFSTLSGSPLSR